MVILPLSSGDRVHLVDEDLHPLCNVYYQFTGLETTDKIEKVTCRRCLKIMNLEKMKFKCLQCGEELYDKKLRLRALLGYSVRCKDCNTSLMKYGNELRIV